MLHESTPESARALEAAENHVDSFVKIAKYCESAWGKYNWMIMFAPDHGAHVNPQTGRGSHGEDTPEDMEITHFYGIYPASHNL